jgi:uncharacterized RDD family membrane protein YckC
MSDPGSDRPEERDPGGGSVPPPPPSSDPPPPLPPHQAYGASGTGPGADTSRASFGQRLVAALLDGLLVGIVVSILTGAGEVGSGLGLLIGFVYYGYFEGGPAGQTVGKRVMNIRVIRDGGGELGWGTALIRHLCRALSAIPCLLGYFWMLWDPDKRTWHDKLSTTTVVTTAAHPPPGDGFGKPPGSTTP